MAFVSGFDYDVFISYAHPDNNKRADTDAKGWVEDLHDVLQQRLAKRLGRLESFAIWWDPHLTGYDRIDAAIADKVRKSALFLCVFSPSYLASSYCLEELQLFRAASNGEGPSDLVHRILKVRHLPVPGDQEPALLREVNGYEFFTVDQKNHARELWRNNQNAVNELYWERAQDLADDMADLLLRLKNQRRSDSPPPVAQSSPTVFLAEATDDLVDVRLKLKRNLKQQGLTILPDTPILNNPTLKAQIEGHLREAHLAVHLVGAEFGDRAFGDGEARSLAHFQYLRAKELGRQRIVWMQPGLLIGEVSDERQRRFLKFLEEETDPQAQVDLQHGLGFESLVEEIVKKAFEVAGKPRPNGQPRRGGSPQINIACQEPDFDEAMAIKNIVYQNKFDVNVAVDDNGPKFATLFQHILKRSDALLILYGKASPAWVAERADQARDAVRKRTRAGRGPFFALVYDGPPPEKRDLPFGYHEVAVVTHRDRIDRDEIVSTIKNHLGV